MLINWQKGATLSKILARKALSPVQIEIFHRILSSDVISLIWPFFEGAYGYPLLDS